MERVLSLKSKASQIDPEAVAEARLVSDNASRLLTCSDDELKTEGAIEQSQLASSEPSVHGQCYSKIWISEQHGSNGFLEKFRLLVTRSRATTLS